MIGIPYAEHFVIAGRVHARCPVCHASIELKERKDFESMTGREYAEHYAREHDTPPADTLPATW